MRQHCDLHGSVEIVLTADVAVAQGLVVGRLVEKSAIKAVLEDRTDRGDRVSLDEDAASAGRIDARVVVAPGQRQDAEAGAKALLGMRSAIVVWPRRLGARAWLAILWPLWKISTVLSAMRTSTSSRIRR